MIFFVQFCFEGFVPDVWLMIGCSCRLCRHAVSVWSSELGFQRSAVGLFY